MSAPLIAVLDYGIGNLRSAQKALQRVGADARLTADPEVVRAYLGSGNETDPSQAATHPTDPPGRRP